jgi:anti-sigma factor RsiW
MRKILDDYLDDTLQSTQRADLERRLASDAVAARLLAQIKSERALRQAAYQSFQPSASQARAFADNALAAMHAQAPSPLGYVGSWIRRGLAVAAAIAIVAASFAIGRMTAAPANPSIATNTPLKTEPQVVYRVVYFAESGDKEVREFASMDEANDFVARLDARRAEPQVAIVDLDHPGSF